MAVVKGNALKTILTKLKDFFALKEDTVTSVNEVHPIDGNVHLEEVYFAENLKSDKTQNSAGNYLIRTSGGEASITDGDAFLSAIKGNSVHDGLVQEVLDMSVYAQEGSSLEASIDRDTFIAYVTSSQFIEFTYINSSWGADLSAYGITTSGTPVANDIIRVNYVKLQRGTITNSNPTSFKSTGWNLYNNGYARLVKYSDQYGYYIGGDYSTVEFAESMSATSWDELTVANNRFMIPSTGYVRVTGGGSDTYILNTWSDWTEGYPEEEIDPYSETTVDISSAISSYYPYGMCKIGNVQDEINIDLGFAYSRIGRIAYDSTNYDEKIAPIIENEYAYDVDTYYIYYVKPITDTPPEGIEPQIAYPITINGRYTVSDHGNEFIVASNNITVYVETMYMNNLKNKLERGVLTVSQQTLTQSQKNQIYDNIGLKEVFMNNLHEAYKEISWSGYTSVTKQSIYVVSGTGLLYISATLFDGTADYGNTFTKIYRKNENGTFVQIAGQFDRNPSGEGYERNENVSWMGIVNEGDTFRLDYNSSRSASHTLKATLLGICCEPVWQEDK